MIKIFFICIFLILLSTSWANRDDYLQTVFEKAQNMIKSENFIPVYEQLAAKYESHLYGQKAILELGKVNLLNRNYQGAFRYFKKLDHNTIIEKEYWLGKTYFYLEEYHYAILSAQNFIFEAGEHELVEDSYFLIVESYIEQKLFQRALNTLSYIRKSQFILNQIPLLYFKMGFSYEQLKQWDLALSSYKKLKKEFPYHHYTYLAEERMLNLQSSGSNGTISGSPADPIAPVRIKKKYLQIGAFSSLQNANRQKDKIEQLGIECVTFTKQSNSKKLYIAAAGPFDNEQALQKAQTFLKNKNISSFAIQR